LGGDFVIVAMDVPGSQLPILIEARQAAGRRCVSLMFAAAMNRFTAQTVSDVQLNEVQAAADEWEAAAQAAAGLEG
jgi:hypothetical protein